MRTLDSEPSERPGTRSGWESTVDQALRRLGVPFDPSVRHVDTAVAHGFAAASVILGHRALEAGHAADALAAFDAAIESLQGHRHVNLGHLLAIAHYSRGTVREALGLGVQALDDYAMTLALLPDHEGARAARERLDSHRPDTTGETR